MSRQKSPIVSENRQSTAKKQIMRPQSNRQTRSKVNSVVSRKAFSRPSSQLSCKSAAIPELELSKSSMGFGEMNDELGKFID